MSNGPHIDAFFDEATNSVSYVVADSASGLAAIIDPVLDFDAASGTVATRSADRAATLPLATSKSSTGSMIAAAPVAGSEIK